MLGSISFVNLRTIHVRVPGPKGQVRGTTTTSVKVVHVSYALWGGLQCLVAVPRGTFLRAACIRKE